MRELGFWLCSICSELGYCNCVSINFCIRVLPTHFGIFSYTFSFCVKCLVHSVRCVGDNIDWLVPEYFLSYYNVKTWKINLIYVWSELHIKEKDRLSDSKLTWYVSCYTSIQCLLEFFFSLRGSSVQVWLSFPPDLTYHFHNLSILSVCASL